MENSKATAYVAPFIMYLVGTTLISRLDASYYPVGYALVALSVAITAAFLLRESEAIKVHWRILPGVLVGTVGIALWIWLSDLQVEQAIGQYLPKFLRPGERVSYNPFEKLPEQWQVWSFVVGRIFGLAIVVPLAEELFWRGFLLRWLIDPDWERVPVGQYTFASCAIVTLMFTMAHPEWLAAAVYCLLINGLLYWKRDIWQCIIAHAVSNFLLAIYVLAFKAWWLW